MTKVPKPRTTPLGRKGSVRLEPSTKATSTPEREVCHKMTKVPKPRTTHRRKLPKQPEPALDRWPPRTREGNVLLLEPS